MDRIENILITGGNGYLGSQLVNSLSLYYKILVVENGDDNKNILFEKRNVTFYNTRRITLAEIFQNKIDMIIHLATIYGKNEESDELIFNTNYILPAELLFLSIKNNVKCFINTDTVLDKNTNPYSFFKKQFREILAFNSGKMNSVNLQLEHFYGPNAGSNNFFSSIIRRMLLNESEIDLTLGEQERDFIFISDLVDLYVSIVRKAFIFKGFNDFKVGTGQIVKLRTVVELLKDLTASTSKLNFGAIDYRENELMKSDSNNEIEKLIDWKPVIKINEGLEIIVQAEKDKIRNE